jgi:protein-S-isoprenylcysteine O-methyltransferase Ste14
MTPALFAAPAVYLVVLALHLALPARWVDGYVTHADGRPYRYRLNGLVVLFATVGLAALACRQGLLPWDYLWQHRWASLAGAAITGLVFTLAIVLPAPAVKKSWLADFYLGRHENPQWGNGRLDGKMYLYLAGAVMLELNILSFAAHHILTYGPSPTILLYTGLLSFFLVEYLFFERVHLYTYDFFAERVGFKLGWGCLTFYPYFYCVGLWSAAGAPPGGSALTLAAAALVFFVGWSFARGANLQKFLFKTRPEARLLGVLPATAISDGRHRLLCGGFWRISRHVNYLGEILMASGLALALGRPADPWPWLYPLYYVALLVPRQIADDARCAAKYGALWDDYCRRVPYRIVPGIY